MCKIFLSCVIGVVCPAIATGSEPAKAGKLLHYTGMCDASAAVALDAKTFIVADDERNSLFVYRAGRGGPPLQTIAWDRHLGIDPGQDEHPEVDIEGAALLDGRIYWISSHGRNRDGKWRPNRHRFFAMTVKPTRRGYVAEPFGQSRDDLVRRLVADEQVRNLGLAEAYAPADKKSGRLAPKKEGLNVEGLCAAADGRSLWIAFRNPRPQGRAIIVPLNNPAAVVTQAAAPRFGRPLRLELLSETATSVLKRGIRGIEYSPPHKAYLIVAGPHDGRKGFAVYRFSGREGEGPELLPEATAAIRSVEDFRPEALVLYPGGGLQLLGDDGSRRVEVSSSAECMKGRFAAGECQQKFLKDDGRKTFRGLSIEAN